MAFVVRRGEGLVLRLADGHSLTVTVDDARSAVRAIRSRLPETGSSYQGMPGHS